MLTDEAACTPLYKLVGNMHNHFSTDPWTRTCHLSAESTPVGAVLTTDIQAITALNIKPGVATHLAMVITRALMRLDHQAGCTKDTQRTGILKNLRVTATYDPAPGSTIAPASRALIPCTICGPLCAELYVIHVEDGKATTCLINDAVKTSFCSGPSASTIRANFKLAHIR